LGVGPLSIEFDKTGDFRVARLAKRASLRLIHGGSGGLCPQSPVAAGQRAPD